MSKINLVKSLKFSQVLATKIEPAIFYYIGGVLLIILALFLFKVLNKKNNQNTNETTETKEVKEPVINKQEEVLKINQVTSAPVVEKVLEEIVEEETEDVEPEVIEPAKKEALVKEKVVTKEPLEATDSEVNTKLNYSMDAYVSLADDETIERFNEIKNHIYSYPNIKESKSWKFERYSYGVRTLAKITLQGKVMRIYLDLDPNEFVDSVYNITDESSKVNHKQTPVMLRIRGPRGVNHAKQLIDIYFAKVAVKQNEVTERDYGIEKLTKEELIEKGLIKVVKNTSNFGTK